MHICKVLLWFWIRYDFNIYRVYINELCLKLLSNLGQLAVALQVAEARKLERKKLTEHAKSQVRTVRREASV